MHDAAAVQLAHGEGHAPDHLDGLRRRPRLLAGNEVREGGALEIGHREEVDAVRAVRQAALECRTAICVIDREEGGVDALARLGVRLYPLFRAAQVVQGQQLELRPDGESVPGQHRA